MVPAFLFKLMDVIVEPGPIEIPEEMSLWVVFLPVLLVVVIVGVALGITIPLLVRAQRKKRQPPPVQPPYGQQPPYQGQPQQSYAPQAGQPPAEPPTPDNQ